MGTVKELITSLNPFQCAMLEVEKDDEFFIEISEYVDLDMIEVERKAEIYVDDLDVNMKILRLTDDWYDITFVKGRTGILGH